MEINNRGCIAKPLQKAYDVQFGVLRSCRWVSHAQRKKDRLTDDNCNKTAKESLDCAWHVFVCLVKQMKRHSDLV